MKKNIVKDKSFAFAVRIVNAYKYLCEKKREYVLSKQLLQAGTSIGALIREAEHAESKQDFIHKNAIAQKEANETLYWLELLKETEYLTKNEFEVLYKDVIELMKLLTSIIITTKNSLTIKH